MTMLANVNCLAQFFLFFFGAARNESEETIMRYKINEMVRMFFFLKDCCKMKNRRKIKLFLTQKHEVRVATSVTFFTSIYFCF